jgi:hypothetical protein
MKSMQSMPLPGSVSFYPTPLLVNTIKDEGTSHPFKLNQMTNTTASEFDTKTTKNTPPWRLTTHRFSSSGHGDLKWAESQQQDSLSDPMMPTLNVSRTNTTNHASHSPEQTSQMAYPQLPLETKRTQHC